MKPAKEKPWWQGSKWYRRPALSWRPYRVTGESAASEYIRWLANARGWEKSKAEEYVRAASRWTDEERAEAFFQARVSEAIAMVEAAA